MRINPQHIKESVQSFSITTIDMHTGGEPLRIITSGFPKLSGHTVLEKRKDLLENYDHLRRSIIFEPRGHADMYAVHIVEPNDDGADFGVIFMHNEGYSTMCGHAVIALGKLAMTQGWAKTLTIDQSLLIIDTPCGRIKVYIESNSADDIGPVRFQCVPSFVHALNQSLTLKSGLTINYDIAFGGAYYAYVQASDLGLKLEAAEFSRIIQLGMEIKESVITDHSIQHPYEDDLGFLYGTIFIGSPHKKDNDSRNVCVFADGEVDRCPTGSGVSGRMALHYAKKELKLNQSMRIESICDSVFEGKALETVKFGPFNAVIPEVRGNAFFTGFHEFIIDSKDPFKTGFILR